MYLKKALRGTLIVFLITALSGGLWYLFRFVLARNLSVYEYGLFFSIFSFFSFLSLFTDVGFSQAVPKFLIDFKLKDKKTELKSVLYFSSILRILMAGIVFCIIFIFSDLLSAHYFQADVKNYILIMGLWFITLPLTAFWEYLFVGFQKYSSASSVDLVRISALSISCFLLLKFNFEILSVFLSFAFINIFLFLFYIPFSRSFFSDYFRIRLKFDKKILVSLVKYGFYVSLSSFVWLILTQTDTLVLTYFKGLEAVGIYQAAVPLASICLYLVNSITLVAYPLASELYSAKKIKEMVAGIEIFYKYIFVILMPIVLVLFSFSYLAVLTLFGSKFVAASAALQILSIGALFSAITVFNNIIISATGNPKKVAKLMLIVALSNLILNLIFVPLWGIVGAASATTISFFFGMILSSILLKGIVNISVPVLSWIKIFVLGVCMALLISLLKYIIVYNNYLELVIVGCVAGVFYVGSCLLLKIISFEEVKNLINQTIKK